MRYFLLIVGTIMTVFCADATASIPPQNVAGMDDIAVALHHLLYSEPSNCKSGDEEVKWCATAEPHLTLSKDFAIEQEGEEDECRALYISTAPDTDIQVSFTCQKVPIEKVDVPPSVFREVFRKELRLFAKWIKAHTR